MTSIFTISYPKAALLKSKGLKVNYRTNVFTISYPKAALTYSPSVIPMSQGCTNQIQRSRNPKQLTYCITMSYLKLSRLLFSNPSVTKTYVYIDKVTRVHIFAFSTVSVYHYYLTSVGPNSSKELCNIIVRHNL